MNKKFNFTMASILMLISVASTSSHAANRLGSVWENVAPAAEDQVRIVYYRLTDSDIKHAANIYVDGEFQTALTVGGFNTFCLSPGEHSLGSYANDAPSFKGKSEQPWRDNLAAGRTYYIQASLDGSGRPLVKAEAEALQQLRGLRQQSGLLSRASSIEVCRTGSNSQYDSYELSSDLLFSFNGSQENQITGEGKHVIKQFIQMLKKRGESERRIIVSGFTDPIGNEQNNLALGQRRADTVKSLLIKHGLTEKNIIAQSIGESQVQQQCTGSLIQQKACYAPERRVVISVEK